MPLAASDRMAIKRSPCLKIWAGCFQCSFFLPPLIASQLIPVSGVTGEGLDKLEEGERRNSLEQIYATIFHKTLRSAGRPAAHRQKRPGFSPPPLRHPPALFLYFPICLHTHTHKHTRTRPQPFCSRLSSSASSPPSAPRSLPRPPPSRRARRRLDPFHSFLPLLLLRQTPCRFGRRSPPAWPLSFPRSFSPDSLSSHRAVSTRASAPLRPQL